MLLIDNVGGPNVSNQSRPLASRRLIYPLRLYMKDLVSNQSRPLASRRPKPTPEIKEMLEFPINRVP